MFPISVYIAIDFYTQPKKNCGIYYQLFFTRVPSLDWTFQISRDLSVKLFVTPIFYALSPLMSMAFFINENHIFRWESSQRYTNASKRTQHKQVGFLKMNRAFASNSKRVYKTDFHLALYFHFSLKRLCSFTIILSHTFTEDSVSYVASNKWLDWIQNWWAKCNRLIWTPRLYIMDNSAKRITWNGY